MKNLYSSLKPTTGLFPLRICLLTLLFWAAGLPSLYAQAVIQSWATLASGAGPEAIAIDASGNVYTANYNNSTVSKITPGGVDTQAWATLASGANPEGIAIDASGNVYTANKGNSTVSKITPGGVDTQAWVTLANGAGPAAIAIDASGNIYTANKGNNTVSKITPGGVDTQSWATLANNAHPYGIAIDASGNIYTANYDNSTVSKITPGGVDTQAWATLASSANPEGIAIDASGNIYTANKGNNTVSKITPGGAVTQAWATLAGNAYPAGIAIDTSGNVYTANYYNNTVSKITSGGAATQTWATLAGGAAPEAIAIDPFGNVYTANNSNSTVSKIIPLIYPDANNILYVDSAASGGDQTGNSWTNALHSLAKALHYARDSTASWTNDSLRIYVAKGTYKPAYRADDSTYATNNRNDAFVMVKNVQLYGGFNPAIGDSTMVTRDWVANPTILSGDIGISNDTSDNCYHVVVSSGAVGNALLNGFTITGGNAGNVNTYTFINGPMIYTDAGGGIINYHSSPAIVHVTVENNYAIFGGGIDNLSSSPTLSHVTITHNAALSGGGILNEASSSPTLTNVAITHNSALGDGGGIKNTLASSPLLTNVTIANNFAQQGGGINNSVSSSPRINNSILFGNITGASGNEILNVDASSKPVFKYTLIDGVAWNSSWGASDGGNMTDTINPFIDSANDNYQLVPCSLPVNAGSNVLYTIAGGNLSGDIDLAGNPRLYSDSIDMGAYESQIAHPKALFTASSINDSTVQISNSSTGGGLSFLWTYGNGDTSTSTSSSYQYSYNNTPGNYTITLIATNSCGSDTASHGVTIDLGIQDLHRSFDLEVLPNPFQSDVHLRLDLKKPAIAGIEIYDLNGKVICHESKSLQSGANIIELGSVFINQPSGVYVISVKLDKGSDIIKKVVKLK